MSNDSGLASPALSRVGNLGLVYNEQAFRYFLDVERARAERSKRPFLVVLVRFRPSPETGRQIEPGTAAKLFSALARAVRETDFFGWYREGQVAGAVLSERPDAPGPDASSQVALRVKTLLRRGLPAHAASRLEVRVRQVRSKPRFR